MKGSLFGGLHQEITKEFNSIDWKGITTIIKRALTVKQQLQGVQISPSVNSCWLALDN